MANAHTDIIYTGRINDLNSELVVMPGTSDWGDQGGLSRKKSASPAVSPSSPPRCSSLGTQRRRR